MKMIGAIGGFAGPSMIGLLAVAEDSYAASMAVLACCLLLGGGMCLGFTEPGKHVSCCWSKVGWRCPCRLSVAPVKQCCHCMGTAQLRLGALQACHHC